MYERSGLYGEDNGKFDGTWLVRRHKNKKIIHGFKWYKKQKSIYLTTSIFTTFKVSKSYSLTQQPETLTNFLIEDIGKQVFPGS